jgi:SAM-dependent methyltransferase
VSTNTITSIITGTVIINNFMNENLKHWYDGRFYDYFIAPSQDRAFEIVKNYIERDSTILDAGCGTGRFCYKVKNKCRRIDGIDASENNIESAKEKYVPEFHHNINFYHSGIKSFLEEGKSKYDYALLSYVIHEIDDTKRDDILNLLSQYAGKIIIVDYLFPHPKTFTGYLNRIVEFLAGKIHYNNFKSYLEKGGIKGLAGRVNLKLEKEFISNPPSSHIAILSIN